MSSEARSAGAPAPMPVPPPLLQDLRTLPRAFWVLFIGTFINRFGTFVWPFLTIYLTGRGFTPQMAGLVIACFGIGNLIGSAFGGWLADRHGRRNTIVLGTMGSAIAYMVLYYASGLPATMLCVTVAAIAGGMYHPAANALLADVVPEPQRLRAYSALRVALNAGFAGGTASAGFIPESSSFWLFAGDALTTAIFGLIAFLWLPHGFRSSGVNAPWSVAVRDMRTNFAFHALIFAALCLGFIQMQFGTTYPIHVLGVSPTIDLFGWHLHGKQVYGLLLAWNGLMVVTMELPLTGWILRFQPRHMLALGYALEGIGFAMNGFCHDFTTLFLAITLFTFGEIASAPVSSAYLARVSPETMRGRYMGALALVASATTIIGPIYGMRLLATQPAFLWALLGILGAAAALVLLLFGKERAASPETAATDAANSCDLA